MNAILLEKPGLLRPIQSPAPTAPPPGYALVRVHRAAVCNSDVHAFRGNLPLFSYPRILGRELAVEIQSIADISAGLSPGDRCAVEPYLNCRNCIACRTGRPNCCANLKILGTHLDGGFAELLLLPVDKLHPCNALTSDQLVLVETLALGFHAIRRAQVAADEWVLVIGAGPHGLSAMQAALHAGAHVIALDFSAARLEFCRHQFKVPHTLDARRDPYDSLRRLTDGNLPSVVIDSTGNPDAMMKAFHYAAPAGRIVFLGLFPGEISFHDPDFHKRELTLLASRNAVPEDFRSVLCAMENQSIDTSSWITHRTSLSQVPESFPTWTDPASNVIKAVIDFPE